MMPMRADVDEGGTTSEEKARRGAIAVSSGGGRLAMSAVTAPAPAILSPVPRAAATVVDVITVLTDGVLCKLCDAEDFFSPGFLPWITAIGETPVVHRKQWEYALIVRDMQASGALHDRADVLGLACETEPVIYYAANHAKSVLASDLYAGSDNPGWAAGRTREADVYEKAPFEYRRDRLKV